MASERKPRTQAGQQPELSLRCPLCRNAVALDAQACGRCGTDLSLLVDLRAKATTLERRGGALTRSGDSFGAWLAHLQAKSLWPQSVGAVPARGHEKPSRLIPALVGLALLEAVLLAVALAIILRRS